MNDTEEMEKKLELVSLLPDRYYIILRQTSNEEFTLSAYDTTGRKYEDEDDFNPAMIVHEGALDLIRQNTDDVYDNGVATIQFRLAGEDMLEDIEDPKLKKHVEGNVVRIDFGKKQ